MDSAPLLRKLLGDHHCLDRSPVEGALATGATTRPWSVYTSQGHPIDGSVEGLTMGFQRCSMFAACTEVTEVSETCSDSFLCCQQLSILVFFHINLLVFVFPSCPKNFFC